MLNLPIYSEPHGGLHPRELREYGFAPEDILDFSVNSNPFGPSPKVLEALKAVDISTYPERDSHALVSALATLNGVEEDQIMVGNGTSELIWLASHASLEPGEAVLIIGPTFGEYARVALALGAKVHEIAAKEPDFEPPVDEAIAYIKINKPKLVFLCNPNNPTGKVLDESVLACLAEACGEQSLLVIDEAYLPFVDGVFFRKPLNGNVLCLRSMTKDFAVAGIRLGYAIGDPALIKKMRSLQPTWSVNVYAQAGGLAILDSLDYYQDTLAKLKDISTTFFKDLATIGYLILPSVCHFGVFKTQIPANLFRQKVLRHGIQLRDCSSFGMPHHIRVSTKLPDQNQGLLALLKTLDLR